MGNRANLLVRRKDQTFIHFDKYVADRLAAHVIRDVLSNPFTFQQTYVECHQPRESNVMNGVWAEAGTLIDLEKRCFTFFGADGQRNRIQEDPLLRYDVLRILQARLNAACCGGPNERPWQIAWAEEGIETLCDLAGLERHLVPDDEELDCHLGGKGLNVIEVARKVGEAYQVHTGTFAHKGCYRYGSIRGLLRGGPEQLFRTFNKMSSNSTLRPSMGLVIDEEAREVRIWQCSDHSLAEVRKHWPGWTLSASTRHVGEVRGHRFPLCEMEGLADYLVKTTFTSRPNDLQIYIRGCTTCDCGLSIGYDDAPPQSSEGFAVSSADLLQRVLNGEPRWYGIVDNRKSTSATDDQGYVPFRNHETNFAERLLRGLGRKHLESVAWALDSKADTVAKLREALKSASSLPEDEDAATLESFLVDAEAILHQLGLKEFELGELCFRAQYE
jgi:hypothetical protein